MSDIKMTEVERFDKALISATDRLEIEGHSDCSNELFVASSAILTTIESQNSQIESLKAITELTVKSLSEIHNLAKRFNFPAIEVIAETTLARIPNGTT